MNLSSVAQERSRTDLWKKCVMFITYDEHGGYAESRLAGRRSQPRPTEGSDIPDAVCDYRCVRGSRVGNFAVCLKVGTIFPGSRER